MHGHNTWQGRNAADECGYFFVVTLHIQFDRFFCIKALLNLTLGFKKVYLRPLERPVSEMSLSKLGISVSLGSCLSIAPKAIRISSSCAL
jgi:hypothetical protein